MHIHDRACPARVPEETCCRRPSEGGHADERCGSEKPRATGCSSLADIEARTSELGLGLASRYLVDQAAQLIGALRVAIQDRWALRVLPVGACRLDRRAGSVIMAGCPGPSR